VQTLVERGCGLDVHRATVLACFLIVFKNGQVQKQVRTFGTITREFIRALGGELEFPAVFGNRVIKRPHLGAGNSKTVLSSNRIPGPE
jgi:hypothetical protein